jgi:hypothetical protein
MPSPAARPDTATKARPRRADQLPSPDRRRADYCSLNKLGSFSWLDDALYFVGLEARQAESRQ